MSVRHLCLVSALALSTAAAALPRITDMERIGSVRIAMTEAELRDALGPAARQGSLEADPASESTTKTWTYARHGLKVRLASDGSPRKPWLVCGIAATEPCHLKTPRGIHLGSTREEVIEAYKADVNEQDSSPDQVVVGRAQDGLLFRLQDSKVTEIDMGPTLP